MMTDKDLEKLTEKFNEIHKEKGKLTIADALKAVDEVYGKEKECEEDDKLAREINEGLDELYGVKENSEESKLDEKSIVTCMVCGKDWKGHNANIKYRTHKCEEDIEEKDGILECRKFCGGEIIKLRMDIDALFKDMQEEQKAFRSDLLDYLDFLIEQITYSKAKDSSKAISDLEALRKKYL